MSDEQQPKIDATALYEINRASRYAAKVFLPDGAKPAQANVVAEKIAVQALGALIGRGEFKLPDRPRTHAEQVEASRQGEEAGRSA